jgi:hypothetical protein
MIRTPAKYNDPTDRLRRTIRNKGRKSILLEGKIRRKPREWVSRSKSKAEKETDVSSIALHILNYMKKKK